jgi:uncharacterized protein (TIGR03083 family)
VAGDRRAACSAGRRLGVADRQWDVQSLCTKWKVRHVVGHLIFGSDMKTGPVLAGIVKSGMNFNRYIARVGLELGAAPSDELLARFRSTVGLHRTLKGAPPEILLVDTVCHAGDIRWPTATTRSIPAATMVTVADTMKGIGFPLQAKKRIAGLRLSATDTEWTFGDGPSVEGPLASLILVMAGRPAPLKDLSGAGAPALRARVERRPTQM